MGLLFLDVVGVLQPWGHKPVSRETGSFYYQSQLHTGCVQLLAGFLVSHPEVRVVLTSEWRNHPEMISGLQRAMYATGLFETGRNVRKRFSEFTPKARGVSESRGEQVDRYLASTEDAGTIVILDDNEVEAKGAIWVPVDPNTGLTALHIERLEQLFSVAEKV